MTDSLVRTQLESSLQASSLRSLVRATTDTPMLLIDTSGSMGSPIVPNDYDTPRRIDALREVVKTIKSAGNVPMIAFGGSMDEQVRFVDDVPEPAGGTPLHLAIPLAGKYGATRLVVLSDGMPDLTEQSIIEAKDFGGRIDFVFIGAPGEHGEAFLTELASVTGGTSMTGDLRDPLLLSRGVIGLLEGEVEPQSAPIQGAGFTTVEDAPEEDGEDEDEEEDEDESDDDDEDDDKD